MSIFFECKMKLVTYIFLTVSLLLSFAADAHKIKTAFSIILFNERTNNLEVVHRFYLHDAEEAVWELFDKNADIIADDKTQALFADYAIKKFELKDQSQNTLPLELLGFQNEGGYFWIYQELPLPKNLTQLNIKQDTLKDIWPEQYNVVNIEGLSQIYTLNFSDHDEWLDIPVN